MSNSTNRATIPMLAALLCAGIAGPAMAQSLACPKPHDMAGPGILRETPAQTAQTGQLLTEGDSVNRASEIAVELRRRYPGVSNEELENYLVAADCSAVAKLNGLSVKEQQDRVTRFADQATQAVYGHR